MRMVNHRLCLVSPTTPSSCGTPPARHLQAKIQDLHKQIEELTVKVGDLQTENAALHSRTSILEKVLDMRNEQIQVMQESKEVRRRAGSQQGAQRSVQCRPGVGADCRRGGREDAIADR